jgi:hypothetical protein
MRRNQENAAEEEEEEDHGESGSDHAPQDKQVGSGELGHGENKLSTTDHLEGAISLSDKVLMMTYINPCLGQNDDMDIDKNSPTGSFRGTDPLPFQQ